MAEDSIRRERVYDPSLDEPQPRRRLNRRDALRVAAGAAIGLFIGDKLTSQESEPQLKDQPKAIYKGFTEILKGINFRTDHTTESTNIEWGNIVEVYGTNIQGKDRFTIDTTLIVDGQNADTLNRTGGDWIAFKAKYRNATGQIVYDYLYVSRGLQTREVVRPNYGFGKDLNVKRVENGKYIMEDGKPFTEQIGIVSFPQAK